VQFELTILGCGAATPTLKHLPTAQAIIWNGQLSLIDAGEGVQVSLRKQRIPFQKIDRVHISHMHGDHVLGLPGLIGSMNLLGRQRTLILHGPSSLESFVRLTLKLTETHLKFPLHFEVNNPGSTEVIFSDKKGATVSSIPVKHRIEAYGYRFDFESPYYNIRKEQIQSLGLLRSEIIQLKKGQDVTRKDGSIILSKDACHRKADPKRYVYSGDTRPCDAIRIAAKNADILYHEATFLAEKQQTAKSTGHTTAMDAGHIAHESNVKKLILGHFSSRYRDDNVLLEEAKTVFEQTELADEGKQFYFNPLEN
jgi:ribonuclease Z